MTRIRPGDCLYELLADVEHRGARLAPWDADGRVRWLDEAGQLLAAVPDPGQRVAWAYALALTLSCRWPAASGLLILGLLVSRAERHLARSFFPAEGEP